MTKPRKHSFPDILARELSSLSPAELQIARTLIESNYLAGMENASRLAKRSGVSAPTVARFSERFGFKSYAGMRDAILRHHDNRLKGPSDLIEDRQYAAPDQTVSRDASGYVALVGECLNPANIATLTDLGRKLANSSVPVLTTGGTFSTVFARHFYLHLRSLRKGCHFIEVGIGRESELIDLRQGTFGVIFDFRRYQPDTYEFAKRMNECGGRIVLITDLFLSPISEFADFTVPVRVNISPPFDSGIGAMTVTEFLISQVYLAIGDPVKKRLARIDELRTELR